MTTADIGKAIHTARAHLREHPADGRGPDKPATAVLEKGLRCRVDGELASIVSDMPQGAGGGATAPTPGWLLRAALAVCDATVIAMRAADVGVELSQLEVTVESESDDRGLFGAADDVPAGPLESTVRVRIGAAGVDADALREIVTYALEHSPVGDAVTRATPTRKVVDVV